MASAKIGFDLVFAQATAEDYPTVSAPRASASSRSSYQGPSGRGGE